MHSQNLEEQYILDYFGSFVGTFADVGCNDCLTFSNTRALALRNWKGIFIDPSPKAMERCKTLYNGYKGYYFYPVAISGHNGKAILNESGPLCSATDVGLVSTFHGSEMARFQRSVTYTHTEVKTFRWKTFFNRLKIKKFDFVSIDCEGSDLEILEQMDLMDVKLVCVEHNGKPELRKQFLEYTGKFGMDKVIYESGENILVCR